MEFVRAVKAERIQLLLAPTAGWRQLQLPCPAVNYLSLIDQRTVRVLRQISMERVVRKFVKYFFPLVRYNTQLLSRR